MHASFLITLTAAVAVTAAPAVQNAAGTTKVPLSNRRALQVRNPDGTANMAAYLNELNRALTKYGSAPLAEQYLTLIGSLTSPLKRANNEPLVDEVQDGEDELYYGTGTVGAKQPQKFTFDFDTGSSDTFVPGPNCGTSQGCAGTTKYSQTGIDQKNTTTITYGSGQVSGENYFDAVTVAGLTADKQNVVSLTQAQGFSGTGSDSLMGLAFQSIANSKQPPFFQTLINEKKVSTQEFAFYLGRAQSKTQDASQLTLGGRDTSKFKGALTQIPVTSQTYWQVALDAVTINGKSAGATTRGQAAIDTGTTIILAPTAASEAIFSQIPGSFPLPLASGSSTITLYAYPCSFKGTVAIQFAGKQFAINALDFNFGQLTGDQLSQLGLGSLTGALGLSGGTCIAGIAAGDIKPAENLYVVGDTFLKNWYSIYSYNNANGKPSVSFAAAVNNQ